MVLRPTRHQLVSLGQEGVGHCFCVYHDLLLVEDKLVGHSLLQGDCNTPDCMIVRSTLQTGEKGSVDPAFKIILNWVALLVEPLFPFSVENQARSHAPQTFVRGRGDNIRVIKWTR